MSETATLIDHVQLALAKAPADSPLYQRLSTALLTAMSVGSIAGGQTLPSERRLSAELRISRVTVRRALELLAREGRLQRQQGAHTRVVDRVQKKLSTVIGFSEELSARGSVPGHRWISRQTVLPTPTEATKHRQRQTWSATVTPSPSAGFLQPPMPPAVTPPRMQSTVWADTFWCQIAGYNPPACITSLNALNRNFAPGRPVLLRTHAYPSRIIPFQDSGATQIEAEPL